MYLINRSLYDLQPYVQTLEKFYSSARIFIPDDLKSLDKRMAVLSAIKEVQRRCNQNIPLIDPEKDMKINTPEFKDIVKKIMTFEKRLKKHSLHNDQDMARLIQVLVFVNLDKASCKNDRGLCNVFLMYEFY